MSVTTLAMEQQTQLAAAVLPFFPARTGALGGLCHTGLCSARGAMWFNRNNGRYYCKDCAKEINSAYKLEGGRRVCSQYL